MSIKSRWMMRRGLKEQKIKEYIDYPYHCPFCKSENIDSEGFNEEESVAFRAFTCDKCKRTWDEIWHLVGIHSDDLDDDEIKGKKEKKQQTEKWEERWHKR